MKIPVHCEYCNAIAHMEWYEANNGWLTRCSYCSYAHFKGLIPLRRAHDL